MRGVQPERRQYRQDLALEISLQPIALFATPLRPVGDVNMLAGQLRTQLVTPGSVYIVDQIHHAHADALQQLARRDAVRARLRRAMRVVVFERRHADLEKLIKVADDDAQVTQSFQQRHAAVARHRQYTKIELQCCQFATQIQARSTQVRAGFGAGRVVRHGPFWPMPDRAVTTLARQCEVPVQARPANSPVRSSGR